MAKVKTRQTFGRDRTKQHDSGQVVEEPSTREWNHPHSYTHMRCTVSVSP